MATRGAKPALTFPRGLLNHLFGSIQLRVLVSDHRDDNEKKATAFCSPHRRDGESRRTVTSAEQQSASAEQHWPASRTKVPDS
jgi:hypothetical protein